MPRLCKCLLLFVGATALCALSPLIIYADQTAAPAGGLLLGHAVDGVTNRPVPGAVVTLTMAGAASPAAAKTLPVAADADGRFFFRDLPKGQYQLSAAALGYGRNNAFGARRPGGAAQVIDLAAGEKLNDITILMWHPAEINGIVLDDAGEPWPNAQVAALPVGTSWGSVAFGAANGDITDDRGAFRIAGLLPGQYVVGTVSPITTTPSSVKEAVDRANGNPEAMAFLTQSVRGSGGLSIAEAGLQVGDVVVAPLSTNGAVVAQAADGTIVVSRTTFYTDVATPKDATRVTVAAGEVRAGVQLQPRLAPTTVVSGVLSGPRGPLAHFGVRLMAAGFEGVQREDGFSAAMTLTDARGAFSFLGVPAGSYVLKANWFPTPITAYTMAATLEGAGGVITNTTTTTTLAAPAGSLGEQVYFANLSIVVSDRPIRDLTINLREAPKATGRIRFEGTTPQPSADQLARAALTFETLDTRPTGFRPSPKAVIDAADAFRVEGLIPARYVVNVSGLAGWTLKAVSWKAHDISDQPVTIESEDLAEVEVTLTDQPAALSGVVRDGAGAPDPTADVLVFSAEDGKRASQRRQVIARVSRTGEFSVRGLPPGEYFVVAMDDKLTADWPSPTFLDALARQATRVSIDSGGVRSVDLRALTAVIR